MTNHGIRAVHLPPYSPDLNPIEHMWYMLKRMVYRLYPEYRTANQVLNDWVGFCKALKQTWRRIPFIYIRRLIFLIPRRLQAVKRAKGYQTKY